METRINKFLADSGVCSRRGAEEYIRNGRVSIDGVVIYDLATKVNDDDTVTLDGRVIERQSQKVYIIMNKPKGVVTSCDDQFSRKTVMDIIGNVGSRVYPIGRLDYNTTGLLLLTNDGEFAKILTHPSSKIKKTYLAVLNKPISDEVVEKLKKGVTIKEGAPVLAKNPNKETNDSGSTSKNSPSGRRGGSRSATDGVVHQRTYKTAPAEVVARGKDVQITITEGKNRQVRKMFESFGYDVDSLKRISIGELTLGNLRPGEWKKIGKPKI
jgi:pseudouridine synthase